MPTAPRPPSGAAEPAAEAAPRRAATGRDLPVAIVSGLALVALFLATIVLHPYAFLTFVALLVTLALLELDVAFRARRLRPATPVALGAGLVMLYGAYGAGPSAQSLGLVLLLLGTTAWALADRGWRTTAARPVAATAAANAGATCLMALWVPFLASFVGLLLARPEGVWLVLAVVALTVTNDIGAFAWGHRFGRRALAPSVSPSKTWEGLGGGLLTVLVVAGLATARVPGFELATALALGAVVVAAATVGDLAESMVKRDLGVKDLGRLLPGHGGIMDRADSLFFTLPAAHLLLLALGA